MELYNEIYSFKCSIYRWTTLKHISYVNFPKSGLKLYDNKIQSVVFFEIVEGLEFMILSFD